ncbi:hypothetical protein [Gordonia sp. N1V]|uniref:hypothetical protein n=1 Tax=Gordonia sp. N1V TaxID=3034163 RepID=UPI0023E32E3F|nr:hypothetical protein [Gordonia sp. N1V]MDF3282577.1 hypothetical protein [Gordonia sp. N1V]
MKWGHRRVEVSIGSARITGAWAYLVRTVLFVAGCGLLAAALAHTGDLGTWSQRWGVMPVATVFALVLVVGVVLFYLGAVAIVAWLIG